MIKINGKYREEWNEHIDDEGSSEAQEPKKICNKESSNEGRIITELWSEGNEDEYSVVQTSMKGNQWKSPREESRGEKTKSKMINR